MAKQLGEFLQEKQEPFAMNVYLVEKGCLKNSSYSSKHFTCKTLHRSTSIALHYKKITLIPNCSKIVRSFITKFASFRNVNKSKKSVGENHNVQEHDDKFSYGSSTTLFNSCSDSEAEEAETYTSINSEALTLEEDSDKYFRDSDHLFMKEINAERKLARRSAKDSNQLSPISVLEEPGFDDDDGASQNHVKRTQESSSKLEKSFEVGGNESQEEVTIGCKFIEHYTKNKNAVLRSKQLLFDCVREVLENQRPKKENGDQLQLQKVLGAQELWKLIYKNIWVWSKEIIVDETNDEQLIHFYLLTNSLENWNNFEEQTREIGIDIALAILEDISNEIITEIINLARLKLVVTN